MIDYNCISFWSFHLITITQKTVIDCNRLQLTITISPCLAATRHEMSSKYQRPPVWRLSCVILDR